VKQIGLAAGANKRPRFNPSRFCRDMKPHLPITTFESDSERQVIATNTDAAAYWGKLYRYARKVRPNRSNRNLSPTKRGNLKAEQAVIITIMTKRRRRRTAS
jgi:hypothetical protein